MPLSTVKTDFVSRTCWYDIAFQRQDSDRTPAGGSTDAVRCEARWQRKQSGAAAPGGHQAERRDGPRLGEEGGGHSAQSAGFGGGADTQGRCSAGVLG